MCGLDVSFRCNLVCGFVLRLYDGGFPQEAVAKRMLQVSDKFVEPTRMRLGNRDLFVMRFCDGLGRGSWPLHTRHEVEMIYQRGICSGMGLDLDLAFKLRCLSRRNRLGTK
jgi:hypothetical protein